MHGAIKFPWILLLAAVSVNIATAAQLYRWVDAKGNVEWRDTPPPATAKKVEQRKMGDNVTATQEVPYAVQLAAKNHPVTLWATDCGPVCTDARAHLAKRAIPYTEKNPQSDFEAFKKISPGASIPLLQVGRAQLKGYLESEWDSALDYAGYPSAGTVAAAKTKPAPPAPLAKPPAEVTPPTTSTPTSGATPPTAPASK